MTVVHNHPHRLAQQVVTPSNAEALQRFGRIRIEDWDDRVSGFTWTQQLNLSSFPQALNYSNVLNEPGFSVSPAASALAVVRCHTLRTGQVVLLHDEWLP